MQPDPQELHLGSDGMESDLRINIQGQRNESLNSSTVKKCINQSFYAFTYVNTETGWDLGPGTLCCRACTWTHVSLNHKTQRNYEGLKVTACMCSSGKLWTRYKKAKKTNCDF